MPIKLRNINDFILCLDNNILQLENQHPTQKNA